MCLGAKHLIGAKSKYTEYQLVMLKVKTVFEGSLKGDFKLFFFDLLMPLAIKPTWAVPQLLELIGK